MSMTSAVVTSVWISRTRSRRRGVVGQRAQLRPGRARPPGEMCPAAAAALLARMTSPTRSIGSAPSESARDLGRDVRVRQQLERELVVADRLLGAADRHRLVAGLDARPGRRSPGRARRGRAGPARPPTLRPCDSRAPRRTPRAAGPARRAAGPGRSPRRAARGGTRSRRRRARTRMLASTAARSAASSARLVEVGAVREQRVGHPPAGDATPRGRRAGRRRRAARAAPAAGRRGRSGSRRR